MIKNINPKTKTAMKVGKNAHFEESLYCRQPNKASTDTSEIFHNQ